jgi:hypothetical protein
MCDESCIGDYAREAGASADEAEFDKNLRRLATTKPDKPERPDKG